MNTRYDPAFCSTKRLRHLSLREQKVVKERTVQRAKTSNDPYVGKPFEPKYDTVDEKRDPPVVGTSRWDSKAVCVRCHAVMPDHEPMSPSGEFFHPKIDKDGKKYKCANAGRCFTLRDGEIEPFMRKGMRRRNKRNGVRA